MTNQASRSKLLGSRATCTFVKGIYAFNEQVIAFGNDAGTAGGMENAVCLDLHLCCDHALVPGSTIRAAIANEKELHINNEEEKAPGRCEEFHKKYHRDHHARPGVPIENFDDFLIS